MILQYCHKEDASFAFLQPNDTIFVLQTQTHLRLLQLPACRSLSLHRHLFESVTTSAASFKAEQPILCLYILYRTA